MMVRLRRYWIQLTADRRKFGMLCTVFGIGLLLWARLIVVSNMPKTAMADPEKSDRPSDRMPITDRSSEERPVVEVELDLDERPLLDPFRVSPDHFPAASAIREFEEPAKSAEQATEDPHLAEDLIKELSLDAAMSGASLAVINGTTYRKGDRVETPSNAQIRFILTDVRPRAVMLEYEGRRFELKMGAPGS